MSNEQLGLFAVFYDGETRPVAGFVLEQEAHSYAKAHSGEGSRYEVKHVHVSEGWQPMETAAKDGTVILGFGESGLFFVMQCLDPPLGSGRWLEKYSGDEIYPTHWMPLPDPPSPD